MRPVAEVIMVTRQKFSLVREPFFLRDLLSLSSIPSRPCAEVDTIDFLFREVTGKKIRRRTILVERINEKKEDDEMKSNGRRLARGLALIC